MKKLNLSDMLANNLGVSLEDNSQVEVNFNIDTDEDKEGDVGESIEDDMLDDDEETADEISNSDEEVEAADADVEELEEVQDSLESLGVVLSKHVGDNTMSRMGMGFYQLALESIAGKEMLEEVAIPSFESSVYSKHHTNLLSLESHRALTHHVAVISMESRFNWLKKLKHKIAVFFKREKALLKRAQGLQAIAQSSENEKASNDTITVNESKGLSLPTLLSRKWDNEKQFLTYVKEFTKVYNDMAEIRDGYSDEFVDNMFPGSRKWKKNEDGHPTYSMFGVRLIRKDLIEYHDASEITSSATVVNLTPAMCNEVLVELIELLRKGNVVRDNLYTMSNILEKAEKVDTSTSTTTSRTGYGENRVDGSAETVHTSSSYPDGYEEMYEALVYLSSIKNRIVTEILNYVNYSLTDREFN